MLRTNFWRFLVLLDVSYCPGRFQSLTGVETESRVLDKSSIGGSFSCMSASNTSGVVMGDAAGDGGCNQDLFRMMVYRNSVH